MNFLNWLIEDEHSANEVAQERLQSTIYKDRITLMNLDSAQLASMKEELLTVINKYFQVNDEPSTCGLEYNTEDIRFSLNVNVSKHKSQDV